MERAVNVNNQAILQSTDNDGSNNILKVGYPSSIQEYAPSLENYMLGLSIKRASAIFRLRCKSTRALHMNKNQDPIPICHLCDSVLASDNHFSLCPATADARAKYNINDLDEFYKTSPDIDILKRYADLAIELGITIE